jgi:hypothetical protein
MKVEQRVKREATKTMQCQNINSGGQRRVIFVNWLVKVRNKISSFLAQLSILLISPDIFHPRRPGFFMITKQEMKKSNKIFPLDSRLSFSGTALITVRSFIFSPTQDRISDNSQTEIKDSI